MTIPRAAALVSQLPVASAVWSARRGEQPGWSLESMMLADVFHALTGRSHPARVTAHTKQRDALREERIRDWRRRHGKE